MNMFIRSLVCVGTAFLVVLGAGCGKKAADEESAAQPAADPAAAAAPQSALPGSQEVTDALNNKQYEEAVAALLRARQNVTTPEQETQFVTLQDELKIKLLEEAPNDPKAAQALDAFRRITAGR